MNRETADAVLNRVWERPGRSTRAVIDLDAIAHNLAVVRSGVPEPVEIIAVVKANAYGHGAVMVAQRALEAGATMLGVATTGEGRQLRRVGLTVPVLVLGPSDPSEIVDAVGLGLTIGIGSPASLTAINDVALATGLLVQAHLKLDTGMHRFGIAEPELDAFLRSLATAKCVHLTGVYSHFARADEPELTPTRLQAERFARMAANVEAAAGRPLVKHLANSAASLRGAGIDLDAVRAGIVMYGLDPGDDTAGGRLRPAMSVVSRVRRVIELVPGDEVSYGGTYQAQRRERAALIPLGYADGYHRLLSSRGWMGVGGRRAPVLGRVCMDQTVVAAGDDVREGDPVGVFGPLGGGPTAHDLAGLAQTLHYEIVTAVAARVPRYYLAGGDVVAVEDDRGLRAI